MICPICKADKPVDEFPKKPSGGPYMWMCRMCERNRASLRKHGLTIEQKAQIAEQHGGCAICGHSDPGSKGWVVDHDHACCNGEKSCQKCRRGILCGWCNRMLGAAFDRPQILAAAIEYLKRHASGTCDWHMPIACAPGLCTETTENTYEDSFLPSVNESHVSDARESEQKNG